MNRLEIINLVNEAEIELSDRFREVEEIGFYYSEKILKLFKECGVNEACFGTSTGYGFVDYGRDVIESIYAKLFGAEDALVRSQIISGSHALAKTFFGLLRPGDTLLSITGTPYDGIQEAIGIRENASSLISFGVKYDQIELVDNDFDDDAIYDYLTNNKVKVIEIQRGIGYSLRKSLTIDKLERIIKKVKASYPDVIIMVDNCYCEMVEKVNPIEVGADIVVGSLIKNLGGGIAPSGGYIVGRKDLVALVGESLTLPGEGKAIGPSLGLNRNFLQGLYFAPSVVVSAVKSALLTASVMQKLGYDVFPGVGDTRADIVQTIFFHNEKDLIKYVQGIQMNSAVDATACPVPSDIPGYDAPIIMASGSFTQGSSIELSCDGPVRPPYVAYQQGGLTYDYAKLGLIGAIEYLKGE